MADALKTRTDRRVPPLASKLNERSARQFGIRCSGASNGDTRTYTSLMDARVSEASV